MRKALVALAAIGSVALVLAAFWLWPRQPAAEAPRPGFAILGLTIGSSMQEARARLDPLRENVGYTPDEKERSGRRVYWKLKGTDYDWVMAWGDPQGRITRIRGVLREGKWLPFREIGGSEKAAALSPAAAKWNLRAADGTRFRMVAQGADEKAQTVYMFALPFHEPAGETVLPTEAEED